MKANPLFLIAALLGIASVLSQDDSAATTNPPTSQAQYKALAQHWAPRIYQDTDSDYYLGEYITKFNFDGDYNGKNNWDNLEQYSSVPAYVYYAVVETATHYFINYSIFHPRDWDDRWWVWWEEQEHENDLEGISLCVKKESGGFGSLVAMATRAHENIYTYAYASGIQEGSDSVEDGFVSLWENSHPKIYIEAKGHGVYNCDWRCSRTNGDGIVYYEGDRADSPTGGDGSWTREYSYKLIAMDQSSGDLGLWHIRNQMCSNCAFASWGRIRGDDHGEDAATAPWAWDHFSDGQVRAGDLFCDPALFFDTRLNGAPFDYGFSHTYVTHPYRTHVVQIDAVRSDKDRDSSGNKSDLYVQVVAERSPSGGDTVIDARAWKKNNANVGTYYPWTFGAMEAEGERSWGSSFNRRSFCRPGGSAVMFYVYDSDNNSDDFMGGFEASDSFNALNGVDVGDARIKVMMDVF